ncbi:anthranilate synthase family protein [Amycolatopsis sp. EV170708-02-1]|uniref:anthranilate synthase family protein n=1 Tax=Amycolatopsis sp. EV170708-02-1 TaxID=2919322 RepID=UPI001F0CC9AE|nr:anthranilate synthase family protein [Amycolatopsis sp. EV170708-02-1]UMP01314.1 anthranilate synthase family protein [Amycolatopsis sp. EV170708-02-1]
MTATLDELLRTGRPFALLHRPETGLRGRLELLTGTITEPGGTADLPLAERGPDTHSLLAILPFRLIGERGYDHHDDGTPILAISVTEQSEIPAGEVVRAAGRTPIAVDGGRFDPDDDTYEDIVRRVVAHEIGQGTGSNFVIKRAFHTEIPDWSPYTALAFYGRLLAVESGAYWTFLIHTGDRTFVGASPERHVSLDGGTAVMNPISGTYRYPPGGPTLDGVLDFLADGKETNELYMVVDEELKMMSRICTDIRVHGPRLKEMARLAHTEYFIAGNTSHDFRDVLAGTLFAPTVTGSPLESACRVITRFEPAGRGYYAGAAVLVGTDLDGHRRMDSAILIRTADIDRDGRLSIGVGSTLVRDSDPGAETAETAAKVDALLAALRSGERRPRPIPEPGPASSPEVKRALASRNDPLSGFWLGDRDETAAYEGHRLLIIDAEDAFTAMGGQLLRALGFEVTVRRFDQPYDLSGYDLVVVGPGPGDPRATADPKIVHLRRVTEDLLAGDQPFLSICLSHQVLSSALGLPLIRRPDPNQGVRRRIDLFGRDESVFFYNTFTAHTRGEPMTARGRQVEICHDAGTGEVHALRGNGFASVQFHPASVMTRDGQGIVERMVAVALRELDTVS